jgi:hypothetical protein
VKSVKLNLLIAGGLVLLFSFPAQSQFVEFVAENQGFSVTESFDEGILVTGNIVFQIPHSDKDLLLAKFDASGNPVWRIALGVLTVDDQGLSVIEVGDEAIVVTGSVGFGAGSGDLFLAKFNASGDTLWTKTLGGTGKDEGRCVIKDCYEGFVVTGYTESFGAGSGDLLLAKFNASGDTLWTKTLGGGYNDVGQSVILTSCVGTEEFVVTGYTESFGAGGSDLLLAKFNASGDTLWTKTFGGAYNDEGRSVIQTSDGGLVVTGYTESFGAGRRDLLLAKFDGWGDTLWTRTLGGAYDEEGWSVTQTSDGGLVVTGSTNSFDGRGDLLLAKFDGSGDLLWTRILGVTDNGEVGHSVIQTSDDNLIVTGWTIVTDIPGLVNPLLARFDASGNTCLGEFVTLAFDSVSPDVGSPIPTITKPSPTITSQSPTLTPLSPFTRVACEVPPRLLLISDVGNDQGGQVQVTWDRCYFDILGSGVTITEYSLWRKVNQYKVNVSDHDFVVKEVESMGQMLENVATCKYGDRYFVTKTGDLWDFIVTIPAMQSPEYSYVAPTLADSTYEHGMYWSVFFVSVHTENPTIHYDSDPDSGYSLDNIPPLPIRDLLVDPNSWFTLQWTVPGEYAGERPISVYDIRFNTVPVGIDTQAWWDSATACTTGEGFFNFIVGETDSLKVAKDCGCHPVVYFAIKGLDSRPNASEISNIVRFKCGDVNGDGLINVTDVVYLINYLFISGPPPAPMATGNANCDGSVNVSDVVYLINSLFVSGSPPPCGS